MTMFFSRWRGGAHRRGGRLQNQQFGGNQGVLYKISCRGGRPARPRRLNALDPAPRCSLQQGRRAASDRVLVLLLTVAGERIGTGQPVILLMVGMRLTGPCPKIYVFR